MNQGLRVAGRKATERKKVAENRIVFLPGKESSLWPLLGRQRYCSPANPRCNTLSAPLSEASEWKCRWGWGGGEAGETGRQRVPRAAHVSGSLSARLPSPFFQEGAGSGWDNLRQRTVLLSAIPAALKRPWSSGSISRTDFWNE